MIEFVKQDNKENIILFVHGFVGGKETWLDADQPRNFIQYLLDDDKISSKFDFAVFNYFTKLTDKLEDVRWFFNLIGRKRKVMKNLSIQDISDLLYSQVTVNLKNYKNLVLIAHSMGGLVSKSYILKSLIKDQDQKAKLYISLSVPHNGSNLAVLGEAILGNPQVKDLAPLEGFINTINTRWIKQSNLPSTIYHQGKYDRVVPKTSSVGYDVRDIDVVYSDDDHFSILSPESDTDVVITSTKNALLKVLETKDPPKAMRESQQDNDDAGGDSFSGISNSTIVSKSENRDSFNEDSQS